jgi:hypothetical protein
MNDAIIFVKSVAVLTAIMAPLYIADIWWKML